VPSYRLCQRLTIAARECVSAILPPTCGQHQTGPCGTGPTSRSEIHPADG
jgi:hypothetical protein